MACRILACAAKASGLFNQIRLKHQGLTRLASLPDGLIIAAPSARGKPFAAQFSTSCRSGSQARALCVMVQTL
jgi:hypothetical protein